MTLKKFLTSKKQLILTHFLVFGLILLFFTPLVSFAETAAAPAAAANEDNKEILEMVWWVVNNTFGLLVWAGGALLDYSISWFVVGFGDFYINKGIGVAIDELWKSVRDIFNLTFIFGLVYIGFSMILGSDSSAKKTLATLIMAALLVNFSLFFTKAVIDFSNIAAKQFVEEFRDKPTYNYKVSEKFMNHVDVQKIIQLDGTPINGLSWGYIFGAMYLYIITGFVFLAGAVMLTVRFIILNIYMLLSPVMFIGWVFPKFESVTKKYWSGFLGQAFFAPAYFLMIYFAMEIIGKLKISLGGGSMAAAVSGGSTSFEAAQLSMGGTITFFLLASGFMIAALIVGKKIGTVGADRAISFVKSGESKTRSLMAKPFKAGAKNVSNRAGNLTSRAFRGAQTYNGPGGAAVRWAARTNFAQDTIGVAAKNMQNAKFGAKRTRDEDRRLRNQTGENSDRRMRVDENNVPPITPASNALQIEQRQNARQVQQATVRRMSNDEILEIARSNKDMLLDQEFASLLSDAQVTAIENSGILSESENDTLNNRRDAGTFADIDATLLSANASNANLTTTMENLNRTMATMSNERLQGMSHAQLTNPNIASQLSDAQITTLQQSGNFTPVQIQGIRNARNDASTTIIRDGSLANTASPGGADPSFQTQQRRRLFRNAQDAGRLPVAVLAHPNSREYLTPQIISEFIRNNPNDGDIGLVRMNVQGYLAGGVSPAISSSWRNFSTRTVEGRRFGL